MQIGTKVRVKELEGMVVEVGDEVGPVIERFSYVSLPGYDCPQLVHNDHIEPIPFAVQSITTPPGLTDADRAFVDALYLGLADRYSVEVVTHHVRTLFDQRNQLLTELNGK